MVEYEEKILELLKNYGELSLYKISKKLNMNWSSLQIKIISLLADKKIDIRKEKKSNLSERITYIVSLKKGN